MISDPKPPTRPLRPRKPIARKRATPRTPEERRAYYVKNRERLLAQMRVYYAKNSERLIARVGEWKKGNRPRINAQARALRFARRQPRRQRKDRVTNLGPRLCGYCEKPIERKGKEQLSGSFRRRAYCDKSCSAKAATRKVQLRKGGPSKGRLDIWFSRIVRHPGECVNCHAVSNLQCAHIVSRRYYSVRYDTANAVCLCARCHLYFTYRPLEWETWVTQQIGADGYAELKRKAMAYRKFDSAMKLEISERLYAEAARLGITTTRNQRGGTWAGLNNGDMAIIADLSGQK